jgi:hypothetical protein
MNRISLLIIGFFNWGSFASKDTWHYHFYSWGSGRGCGGVVGH